MIEYKIIDIVKNDFNFLYTLQNNICEKYFYIKREFQDIVIPTKEPLQLFYSKIENDFEIKDIIFLLKETRDMFNVLINTRTVGLKTALLILEFYDYDQISRIAKSTDLEKLTTIKGVGAFTAKLIIDELQEKLFKNHLSTKKERVLISLEKIGYKTKQLYNPLLKIEDSKSEEEMVNILLKEISNEK